MSRCSRRRLLLALPLLLLAEVMIDPVIRAAGKEFVATGIVHENELPAFEHVLHAVQRLRDSPIPEFILLGLALIPAFLLQPEWRSGGPSSWHSTGQNWTAAGWWFVAISTPLFRFVLLRWVFRYFVWALLLWRISRLPLHLMATHPDRAAGLGFLSIAQGCFGILLFALGCVFAGHVANSVVHEGSPLTSFRIVIPAFIVLSAAIGLCPLALWTPTMSRVRKEGLRQYARLGDRYAQAFDRKWVQAAEPPAEPLLGTADVQSLADLGNSYAVIQQMSLAPITKGLAALLTVMASAPLLPIAIYATPTSDIVKAILKIIA